MAVEKLDQRQETGTANAGFGEFANTRYRGMGFIPAFDKLTAISFNAQALGSKGVKVFIYAADSNSIPTGSELYSFTITNANLSTGLTKYTLPTPLTVTPGSQYCYYLAPWDTGTNAYADDYRDFRWNNADSYSAGKPIVYSSGSWSVSDSGNLDAHFETYGKANTETGSILTLRPNATGVTNNMDSAQGTGSPASKLAAINEATADDDVSYIYDPTANSEEYFNLADGQVPSGSTINRIRVWLRWKGVDPVDATCKIAVYIGSTKYLSDTKQSRKQNDYRDDYYDWATNPNTSSTWTSTDIDNLQIGIKNLDTVGKHFTQLYVEVDYTLTVTPVSVSDSGTDSESIGVVTPVTITDSAVGEVGRGRLLFSDDFSGNLSNYLVGAGTWNTTGGTLNYPSNTGGAWVNSVLITNDSTFKNFELYCRVKKATSNVQIVFRSSTTHGYGIQIRDANNFRLEDWGVSNVSNVAMANNWTIGNWYRVRIRMEGNRIRARVWNDTDPEPNTWTIDYTDTANSGVGLYPNAGAIGFSTENTTDGAYDDLFVWSSPVDVVFAQTVSDSSSAAADALSLLATLAITDTSSESDSLSVVNQSTNISVSDVGSGAEAIAILAQIALSDSSLATDAVNILAQIAMSDNTNAASDAVNVLAQILTSDSSTATDALNVLASISVSESSIASEALTILGSFSLSDLGNGTDLLSLLISIPLSDASGITIESISSAVTVLLSDSSNPANDVISLLAQISVSDNENTSEAITIIANLLLNDTSLGSEVLAILSQILLSDVPSQTIDTTSITASVNITDVNGLTSEIISLLAMIAATDSSIATDALQVLINISLSDIGNGTDAQSILVSLAQSDSAIGGEAINILSQVPVNDTGSSTDNVSLTLSRFILDIGREVESIGLFKSAREIFISAGKLFIRLGGGFFTKDTN